jgi:TusA-related sulfurtransferase
VAVESLAGVANPFELRPIPPTARVVYVGSGAGFHSVTVARAVGPLAAKRAVFRRRAARAASGWGAAVRQHRQRAAGIWKGLPQRPGDRVTCRWPPCASCRTMFADVDIEVDDPVDAEPAVRPTLAPSTSTGIPSVPSSADPQPGRPERPTLVGNTGDGVGFLDAPGVDAGALFATVDDVLADMPAEAILTVFTDDPAGPEVAAEWCAERGVELLAIIRHKHEGTTLTFRRADPPA